MWSNFKTEALLGNVKDAWNSIEQSLDAAVGSEEATAASTSTSSSAISTSSTILKKATAKTSSTTEAPAAARRSPTDFFESLLASANLGSLRSAPVEPEPEVPQEDDLDGIVIERELVQEEEEDDNVDLQQPQPPQGKPCKMAITPPPPLFQPALLGVVSESVEQQGTIPSQEQVEVMMAKAEEQQQQLQEEEDVTASHAAASGPLSPQGAEQTEPIVPASTSNNSSKAKKKKSRRKSNDSNSANTEKASSSQEVEAAALVETVEHAEELTGQVVVALGDEKGAVYTLGPVEAEEGSSCRNNHEEEDEGPQPKKERGLVEVPIEEEEKVTLVVEKAQGPSQQQQQPPSQPSSGQTRLPAAAPPTVIDNAASIRKELMEKFEGEVRRLQGLLRDSDKRINLLEDELRKSLNSHMNSDDAKQKQIAGLLEEGRALAFKQSEMEKAVRRSRADLKEVEVKRNQLQEDKEALEMKVETLTELVKKKETENSALTQSLAAVQAVNQASTDRIAKMEMELDRARDELTGSKAALEKAWSEEKDLKRMITEMTAEQGTLLHKLDEDKALTKGLEGIRKDFEQRELLLQATNKQLQEALSRANFEAGLREDNVRQELAEMRKRWQDAVSRTESLAADMHESTSPLLRQIKALQEEARIRASAWGSAEETLTERARTAETAARAAEATRLNLSGKIDMLTGKLAELEVSLNNTNSKLQEVTAQLRSSEVAETEAVSRATILEQELHESRESARRLAKETKWTETKLKLQLQDAKDALLVVKGDYEDEKARLQVEVDTLKKDLADISRRPSALQSYSSSSPTAAGSRGNNKNQGNSPLPFPLSRPKELLSQSSILERTISSSSSGGGAGGSNAAVGPVPESSRGKTSSSFSFKGNGEVSVLAGEKLQQALRQKEQEVAHLQQRLLDVERTRDALTQEVAMLGNKHSQLQGSLHAAKVLKAQVGELAKTNDVLLELLGEKTEEWEALKEEMVDLKAHFRRQLDDLLKQQQGGVKSSPASITMAS